MSSLLMGVVLYSAVTAVLFANLTISKIVYPFTSLENIGDIKTHALCVREESFVYNEFKVRHHNLLKDIFGSYI